jgi:nicotinamidase-related amidase
MYPPMRLCAYALLQSARLFGVPVVHLQMTVLPDSRSESPAQLRFNARMAAAVGGPVAAFKFCLAGTDGHRFLPEFEPAAGETVVPKWRSSGFAGTGLDLMLRSNAVQSLVLAGCTTEGCVESTARDALFLDYHVVIAEDCVASHSRAQHDASLFLMRHRFDVAPAARIADSWAAGRERIVSPAAAAAHE